jgi:hypothetical protein
MKSKFAAGDLLYITLITIVTIMILVSEMQAFHIVAQ